MKTVKETLLRAKQLIEDEANWHPSLLAADRHGKECSPSAWNAVKWCALGAVQKVAAGFCKEQYPLWLLCLASEKMFGTGIVRVNESYPHVDVMQAFTLAIIWADMMECDEKP